MIGSPFARLRAFLLLAAFGLSLAGQAVAATSVVDQGPAAQPQPMMVTDAGGIVHCSACDQANRTAVAPGCVVAFCWGLAALPVQFGRGARAQAVVFAPAPSNSLEGLPARPEPHPPRAGVSI